MRQSKSKTARIEILLELLDYAAFNHLSGLSEVEIHFMQRQILLSVVCTAIRCLTRGIRSEKCIVRRVRCCAKVIECTYTNLDSIAYYTPRPYGIAYCS